MEQQHTQYQFYDLVIHDKTEHTNMLAFQQRYPQAQVRNKFNEEDYLGFYPMFYEVMVEDESTLKLAFLMLFPNAILRCIMNCSIAIGLG